MDRAQPHWETYAVPTPGEFVTFMIVEHVHEKTIPEMIDHVLASRYFQERGASISDEQRAAIIASTVLHLGREMARVLKENRPASTK